MPTDLHIRRVAAGDWPATMEIQAQAYTFGMREEEAVLRSKAAQSPQTCLVAQRANREIVAYILAHSFPVGEWPQLGVISALSGSCQNLFVHDLAVLPSAAGQGIGGQMMEHVMRLATELGFSSMSLVAVQNAAGFWRKQGFESVGQPSPEKGYDESACLMTKPL